MALSWWGVIILLAGLLALDPHRLYIYWDVSGLDGLTLTLQCGGGAGSQPPRAVQSRGSLYLEDLPANRHYQAEFTLQGELVLRTNPIELPPDHEFTPAPQPEPEPPELDLELPSSASLLP